MVLHFMVRSDLSSVGRRKPMLVRVVPCHFLWAEFHRHIIRKTVLLIIDLDSTGRKAKCFHLTVFLFIIKSLTNQSY